MTDMTLHPGPMPRCRPGTAPSESSKTCPIKCMCKYFKGQGSNYVGHWCCKSGGQKYKRSFAAAVASLVCSEVMGSFHVFIEGS